MVRSKDKLLFTSIVVGLGFTAASFATTFALSADGQVQLNTEVSTSLAMKIASPNDTNPDCMVQSGVTYGEANRYATSNGAEGSKQVDTFDGTVGGADELNTNTSCATLTMTPNTFDSTYSDVTVYTNSGNGYALTLQSAEGVSPNLVNTTDSTYYIPAGSLTESNGNVPGGQNAWAYKTDNGIITNWTAASSTAATIKSYDQETSGGDTTRVTYGISAGNNPTGKYATTLTYTATMFDGFNPYVSKLDTSLSDNISVSESNLSIPFGQSKTITVSPAEGYYLSGVSCPEGFTCTGYNTGIDYTESQTITVRNNNSANTGTVGVRATVANPWANAGCDTATKNNPCTVNGVQYIKLADGHYWTKYSQGEATWDGAASKCPSGTTVPTVDQLISLVSNYGGTSDADKHTNSTALYNATGWQNHHWSSTPSNSQNAWYLWVDNSSSGVFSNINGHNRPDSLYNVVCIR